MLGFWGLATFFFGSLLRHSLQSYDDEDVGGVFAEAKRYLSCLLFLGDFTFLLACSVVTFLFFLLSSVCMSPTTLTLWFHGGGAAAMRIKKSIHHYPLFCCCFYTTTKKPRGLCLSTLNLKNWLVGFGGVRWSAFLGFITTECETGKGRNKGSWLET